MGTKGLSVLHHYDEGVTGGGKRDRTADLLHAMQALSQLSYTPLWVSSLKLYTAFQAFLSLSITFSREKSESTASSDGVCDVPITSTRTGIAIAGILMPCSTNTSLIADEIAALSQVMFASFSASVAIMGRTASVRCCA